MDKDHNGFSDCQDLSCRGVAGVDCTVETSIVDIQTGTVPATTQVALTNVVVTAVAKFRQAGSTVQEARIWVADSATAAPSNGILVFKPTISGTNGASIDNLIPGDIVNVTGPTKENFDETQINGGTLERVGTGPAPTPLVVSIDMLTTPASAEVYEGVLLTVANQKVVSTNPDGAMDFGEWSVGTASSALRIDDVMFKKPTSVAIGDCFASITGTLGYGFSNYKLEPRSAGDVVTGGTCP
jgi:predicted extracellular nuclease